MLDDLLYFLHAEGSQLGRINLNVMRFHEIPSACRPQPPIKSGLMPKREPKAAKRYFLDPSLQLFIRHDNNLLVALAKHIPGRDLALFILEF